MQVLIGTKTKTKNKTKPVFLIKKILPRNSPLPKFFETLSISFDRTFLDLRNFINKQFAQLDTQKSMQTGDLNRQT